MLVVGYGTLNGTDYWLLKNRYPCITVLIFAVGILVCVYIKRQIMKARFIITCTHVDIVAVVLIILCDKSF